MLNVFVIVVNSQILKRHLNSKSRALAYTCLLETSDFMLYEQFEEAR